LHADEGFGVVDGVVAELGDYAGSADGPGLFGEGGVFGGEADVFGRSVMGKGLVEDLLTVGDDPDEQDAETEKGRHGWQYRLRELLTIYLHVEGRS
jgi:hypothetical protein